MATLPGSFKRKSLIGQIDFMELALNNAGTDTLSKYLIPIGYDAERLNEGKGLLAEVQSLEKLREHHTFTKKNLLNQRDAAIAILHERSGTIRKLIKTIYKNEPGVIHELGIHIARAKPKQINLWIKQTGQLYRNLTKQMAKPLHVFGIDLERIREDIKMLENIEQLENNRVDAAGSAMRATAERNSALKTVQEWITDFIQLAQITLRSAGCEQLMESMGILVRS